MPALQDKTAKSGLMPGGEASIARRLREYHPFSILTWYSKPQDSHLWAWLRQLELDKDKNIERASRVRENVTGGLTVA